MLLHKGEKKQGRFAPRGKLVQASDPVIPGERPRRSNSCVCPSKKKGGASNHRRERRRGGSGSRVVGGGRTCGYVFSGGKQKKRGVGWEKVFEKGGKSRRGALGLKLPKSSRKSGKKWKAGGKGPCLKNKKNRRGRSVVLSSQRKGGRNVQDREIALLNDAGKRTRKTSQKKGDS